MSTGGFGGEEIKQESSWRYPLGIFLATLILCAIFLYYYVGPSVNELGGNVPSPAVSEEHIDLVVGDLQFSVPANYTVYPRDRRGGQREEVFLYALWPTFSGYAPARREEFVENPSDGRRIDITLTVRTSPFTEQERIEKLYLPHTVDARGARTSFQMLRYDFREQRASVPTNGYADAELYIGETDAGDVIGLFCLEEREEIESPDCWREYEINETASVVYRFKRPYLTEWRKIDAEVRAFVEGLITTPSS